MTLEISINIVTTGICVFCAHLLLLRRRDPGVYLPLALLFLFQGLSTGVAVLEHVYDPNSLGALFRISLILAGLEIAIPFLFWSYVRALTTEGEPQRIPKLWRHMAPILVVVVCFWTLLFLPPGFQERDLAPDDPRLMGLVIVSLLVLVADVVFTGMIATYVYLTIRRLLAYRARLKDVFASTENRELTWIWVIMVFLVFYLCVNVAFSVSVVAGAFTEKEINAWMPTLNSAAVLAVFWVIGVWGLRQRPGLMRAPIVETPDPDPAPVRKYEKSALDEDRLKRIARKIDRAMSQDMLYRDPNLSLWDLAKHIGVTSHYVSQALNTQLNKSFFDLINGWRIKDAVTQLNSTDETILMIAYDVGFNSRSAFYKAFKRETGKTPSDIRK
ncbi:MAG: helix-turn-helix domain-containing protein [Sulfitobacter sp.]